MKLPHCDVPVALHLYKCTLHYYNIALQQQYSNIEYAKLCHGKILLTDEASSKRWTAFEARWYVPSKLRDIFQFRCTYESIGSRIRIYEFPIPYLVTQCHARIVGNHYCKKGQRFVLKYLRERLQMRQF